MTENTTIRAFIEGIYSLQWCRENPAIPIAIKANQANGGQKLSIAIGNISHLGIIRVFIKQQVANTSLQSQYIEKPINYIKALLDRATQELLIRGNSNYLDNFKFSAEQIIEKTYLALSSEIVGAKIQLRATKIQLNSAYKEERYVRTGGGKTP